VKLRLTEKSLELLLRSKVPAEIVEGLRPVRDQDYTDPDLFWEAISHHLSTEKTASYRSRIRVSALDGAIELDLLLDEAIERAREVVNENSPHLPEAERQIVSEAVGIGAVKYADLSQNRTSDYIFSWEKMLAMNGNTATYLQYAFARCRSIFRKGEIDREDWARLPHALVLNEPDERRLAIQLLRFSEALDATTVDYRPNLVTSYLWDLANAYSSFHQNCAVLKAPTPDVRDSRLALCDLTARTLRLGLGLLGIETIDRM
jgi:arginyl-tRNA synthetase